MSSKRLLSLVWLGILLLQTHESVLRLWQLSRSDSQSLCCSDHGRTNRMAVVTGESALSSFGMPTGIGLQVSLSAGVGRGALVSLGGIDRALDEKSVKVPILLSPPSFRSPFVARLNEFDDPISQRTSVGAFRLLPLVPFVAFFLRGLVGLVSPGSKTSSGRLQLFMLVSHQTHGGDSGPIGLTFARVGCSMHKSRSARPHTCPSCDTVS